MSAISHIAIWAKDLEALCHFYHDEFGLEIGPLYANQAKGFSSRFLSFPAGARIEVMSSSTLGLVPVPHDVQRYGLAHFALSLGSEQRVDDVTAGLRARGAPVLDGPRRTGDGYYESVVLDPEGNRVELTV